MKKRPTSMMTSRNRSVPSFRQNLTDAASVGVKLATISETREITASDIVAAIRGSGMVDIGSHWIPNGNPEKLLKAHAKRLNRVRALDSDPCRKWMNVANAADVSAKQMRSAAFKYNRSLRVRCGTPVFQAYVGGKEHGLAQRFTTDAHRCFEGGSYLQQVAIAFKLVQKWSKEGREFCPEQPITYEVKFGFDAPYGGKQPTRKW